MLPQLRELGDGQVLEQRHVRDGKFRTSAGASAGIDMMLACVAVVAGDDTARKVQLAAGYCPSGMRYGPQAGAAGAPACVCHA